MRYIIYLLANHALLNSNLLKNLQDASEAGETLHRIEHFYKDEDPVLIRSGLYSLLHTGFIRADDWQVTSPDGRQLRPGNTCAHGSQAGLLGAPDRLSIGDDLRTVIVARQA